MPVGLELFQCSARLLGGEMQAVDVLACNRDSNLPLRGSCYLLQPDLLQGKTKEEETSRQKNTFILKGCVVYSNSLYSFIKPSLTQNMSPKRMV